MHIFEILALRLIVNIHLHHFEKECLGLYDMMCINTHVLLKSYKELLLLATRKSIKASRH